MVSSERYKILKLLQKNTKITRYLVFDEIDKCKKVISETKKKLNSEDMIKDTLKIDYPGLPRITDIFISGENHCTVCEYVEGESVFDYINEKGVLDIYESLDIFLKILKMIKFLHEIKPEPIIHNNIHHDNVILIDEEVYLIDYGIKDEKKNPYIAPESIIGNSENKQQDIYSLGILLNYMITGNFKKPQYSNKQQSSIDILISRCTMLNLNKRFDDVGVVINECNRILNKIKAEEFEDYTPLYATIGIHKTLFKMVKLFSEQKDKSIINLRSKKVLIIDTDLLHPSFNPNEYVLNESFQKLIDREDKVPLKPAVKGTEVYIIPCDLIIENYENIVFTQLEKVISDYAEDFDAIFIKCSDFIYDSLTVNSIMIADQTIFFMNNPLYDIKLFNSISRYLCSRHNMDKKRFNFIMDKSDSKKEIVTGIEAHVYGDYLGTLSSKKRWYNNQYKPINLLKSKV